MILSKLSVKFNLNFFYSFLFLLFFLFIFYKTIEVNNTVNANVVNLENFKSLSNYTQVIPTYESLPSLASTININSSNQADPIIFKSTDKQNKINVKIYLTNILSSSNTNLKMQSNQKIGDANLNYIPSVTVQDAEAYNIISNTNSTEISHDADLIKATTIPNIFNENIKNIDDTYSLSSFPPNPILKFSSLKVPILMYHYIRLNPDPKDLLGAGLSVTPTNFEQQMNYLSTNGYFVITTMDLVNALKDGIALSPKSVIITFDDGYKDLYTTAFPILKKYNFKAEAYIITGFVGQDRFLNWDNIHQLILSGLITIGSHTVNHLSLTDLPKNQVDYELSQSKAILEKNLGVTVTDFCYPTGSFNNFVISEAQKYGYLDATTTMPGYIHKSGDYYTMTRVRVSGGEQLSDFINGL